LLLVTFNTGMDKNTIIVLHIKTALQA